MNLEICDRSRNFLIYWRPRTHVGISKHPKLSESIYENSSCARPHVYQILPAIASWNSLHPLIVHSSARNLFFRFLSPILNLQFASSIQLRHRVQCGTQEPRKHLQTHEVMCKIHWPYIKITTYYFLFCMKADWIECWKASTGVDTVQIWIVFIFIFFFSSHIFKKKTTVFASVSGKLSRHAIKFWHVPMNLSNNLMYMNTKTACVIQSADEWWQLVGYLTKIEYNQSLKFIKDVESEWT